MTTASGSSFDLLDTPTADDRTEDAAGSGELAALTAFDRCDSPGCSAQAYVRARLTSGLELVFCAHHGRELSPVLAGRGATLRDDSHLLVEDRLHA